MQNQAVAVALFLEPGDETCDHCLTGCRYLDLIIVTQEIAFGVYSRELNKQLCDVPDETGFGR